MPSLINSSIALAINALPLPDTPITNPDSTVPLFLDDLFNNSLYKGVITLPVNAGANSGETVRGFVTGDFAFQAKANYKDLVSIDLSNATQATAILQTVFPGVAGQGQIAIKSTRATENYWAGSESPEFNFKLVLPNYRSNIKPLNEVKKLMKCIYPVREGEMVLRAPNRYYIDAGQTEKDDKPIGAVHVRLGKFFDASDQIITSVSPAFSEAKSVDGTPLYVSIDIQFRPWRLPDYNDIIKYFIL